MKLESQVEAVESIAIEFEESVATIRPDESEIAAVAYQLWLGRGCPEGSAEQDWFQAQGMLENALRAQSEVLFECHWQGHWEIWEREWAEPRWISDVVHVRR